MLSFATAAALSAQVDPADQFFNNNGYPKCRWFVNTTEDQRLGYLLGYHDALVHTNDEIQARYNLHLTYGEDVSGIAKICAAPENANIQVIDAYLAFAMKTKGSTQSSIDSFLAGARVAATIDNEPPVPPPPKRAEPKREKRQSRKEN
jgi:hypothetical protein